MNKALVFGAGLGLGTGLMYLLDPNRGKRRRALLRDKCVWAARKTGEGFEVTARDLRNRSQGIITELQSRFSSEPVDDAVLVDRVRSKLGRIVSHPSAIQVTSQNGNVTLAGPILAAEVPELLTCVIRVAGVNDVIDNLEVHEEAGNHPALQGGREREGSRFEFFQENWSPAARFVAGAAGASLAVYGGVRHDALGAGLGAAGLLLLTRGVTNADFMHLAGVGSGQGEVQQQLPLH
ncbi:MAG TPA: BON domain-containing protein [Pyrinomonadaceae bacterium]|nr:BON domain-containing protein [Pyrinomonadaceae bacterium]